MSHRILVVDDEPDITALVAYHLARAGYRVSTAASGTEALHSARETPPDVIVLDLMLPGHSGYDVLTDLRRDAATRDIGVILLTARREEVDRIRGLELGADDYLTKPFSPQVDGEGMNLTATEYRLLEILVERRGRAQSRAQLLETVWEAQPDIQTRTVDMHVQRLRAKLGEGADLIETVRGLGYRFRSADEDAAR